MHGGRIWLDSTLGLRHRRSCPQPVKCSPRRRTAIQSVFLGLYRHAWHVAFTLVSWRFASHNCCRQETASGAPISKHGVRDQLMGVGEAARVDSPVRQHGGYLDANRARATAGPAEAEHRLRMTTGAGDTETQTLAAFLPALQDWVAAMVATPKLTFPGALAIPAHAQNEHQNLTRE